MKKTTKKPMPSIDDFMKKGKMFEKPMPKKMPKKGKKGC